MLRDAEIVALRNNSRYKSVTGLGLKRVAADLVRQRQSDLKPEVGAALKLVYAFAKARVVRRELYSCSTDLLERFLNHELAWPRRPASVRDICEAERDNYLWMRFDVPRVDALLSRCKALMGDAGFRDLVKGHSTLSRDKNSRLAALLKELIKLHRDTVRSIRTRGVFDNMVELQRDEFYEANEDTIQKRFLEAARSGTLGQLPAGNGDHANG